MTFKIERRAYVDMYGPTVGDRVRLVARRLAASTRRDRLAVLTDFRRLVRLRRDRYRALVDACDRRRSRDRQDPTGREPR